MNYKVEHLSSLPEPPMGILGGRKVSFEIPDGATVVGFRLKSPLEESDVVVVLKKHKRKLTVIRVAAVEEPREGGS